MRRRQLLALPFVAPFFGALAKTADAQPNAANRKPVLVRAGRDRDENSFRYLDATFHVMVSGKDNGGRCVIFDTLRHEKAGPPLHLHTDCDEWFLVRDGEFKFQVGQDIVRLQTGDALLVPQDTPHTFVKTSDGVARLIVMHQPAGSMEEYFRTVVTLKDQSLSGRQALLEKHGMRVVGPPLKAD